MFFLKTLLLSIFFLFCFHQAEFVSCAFSDDVVGVSYSDVMDGFETGNWYIRTRSGLYDTRGNAFRLYSTNGSNRVYNQVSNGSVSYPEYPSNNLYGLYRVALIGTPGSYNDSNYHSFRYAYVTSSSSSPQYISGGNMGFVHLYIPFRDIIISGGSYSGYREVEPDFYTTNIPMFFADDFLSGISVGSPAYNWLMNGELDNTVNIIDHGFQGSAPYDIGYLSGVRYFVDSAAYQYDQANTPEYITWDSVSTSGIDLNNSKYYVEFMLEDKSTYLRNSATDSWVSNVPYGHALAYTQDKLAYLSSYVFPSGSDQRALLQGKLAKTSLYGQKCGIGTVAASTGKFSFSCAKQYRYALANDSSSDKGVLYGVVDDVLSNNTSFAESLFNNFNSSGKNLNFTYDLYACIVDTSTGQRGNWLKIDRHNSPIEIGGEASTINGRVTASTGHVFYRPGTTVKYVPVTQFEPTSDDTPTEDDPVSPIHLPTGFHNPATGDNITTYNNYQYFYYNTYNTTNNYNTENNFYDLPHTDVVEDQNNILKAIDIFKSLGLLSTIFSLMFSPILPIWASAFIGLAFTIIIAFAVWRCIKGVLPFV